MINKKEKIRQSVTFLFGRPVILLYGGKTFEYSVEENNIRYSAEELGKMAYTFNFHRLFMRLDIYLRNWEALNYKIIP